MQNLSFKIFLSGTSQISKIRHSVSILQSIKQRCFFLTHPVVPRLRRLMQTFPIFRWYFNGAVTEMAWFRRHCFMFLDSFIEPLDPEVPKGMWKSDMGIDGPGVDGPTFVPESG